MGPIVDGILVLILLTGGIALFIRDMVAAVVLLSVFSLLSALAFYLAYAPDVAITEAAIGTGVSTLTFAWAVHRTGRRDDT